MKYTSIRTKILKNFIVVVLLISTLLLGLQYYASTQLVTSAVKKNFTQTSDGIVNFIEDSQNYTKNILNVLSMNTNLYRKLKKQTTNTLVKDFTHLMLVSSRVKGIYAGYKNNNFFEVINLKNNPSLYKIYNVKKDARWAVITIIHKSKKIEFLDKDLNIMSTFKLLENINISTRPWYKMAIANQKTTIRTDVYKFKSTNSYGITFAKYVEDTDAVIALDYTLDELNKFLQEQNFDDKSYIILYKENGDKIATSREIDPSALSYLIDFFQKHSKESTNKLMHKGVAYFTYHTVTNIHQKSDMHIGVLIPQENLFKPYMEKIINSLYGALAFIVLMIPFILYSTSKIVQPIYALIKENEKVKQRNFAEVDIIETDIKELHDFSLSFVSMSKSIGDYQKAQEELLDAIVKLIAQAIDAKSTYTGGHCKRVPEIAKMLAEVASDSKEKPFEEFAFTTDDERREFHIAAWLHDCGKVTTPEYVVDKATKLETIYNRIHEIRTRFEVILRDTKISYLEKLLDGKDKDEAFGEFLELKEQLVDDFAFIASLNIGSEFISQDMIDRLKEIAEKTWSRNFDNRLGLSKEELLRYKDEDLSLPVTEKLLSDRHHHIIKREGFDYEAYKADGFNEDVPKYLYNHGEIYNLSIEKGTLTKEERFKIDEHVIMTIKMLEKLPFPKNMKKIPEYAGTHHETMIGDGYPRGLTKKDLSIPSRIMAIADIFEALTASDRPYKQPKTLSQALKIMSFMAKEGHIDTDIFKLFIESDIYMEYAKIHLKQNQIDEVDKSSLF